LFFFSEKLSIFAPKLRKIPEMDKSVNDKFRDLFDDKIHCFSRTDLKPKLKKLLYHALKPYGMSLSTFYLRFFAKGFKTWEIHGIQSIKKSFISAHRRELLRQGIVIDARRTDGSFYAGLQQARLVGIFTSYMYELGMSQNTAYTRFTKEKWKPWEIRGLKNIIIKFLETYKNDEYV